MIDPSPDTLPTVGRHELLLEQDLLEGPTPLGDAFAHFGRIFKSLHVLSYVDDESYRRGIKGPVQPARRPARPRQTHLPRQEGQLRQTYQAGMEDQLGALGLVLNCVTLWNTVYLDAGLDALHTQAFPVLTEDKQRLSPFARKHINVHGHYSFSLPDLPGGRRPLRDPDDTDDTDEEEG